MSLISAFCAKTTRQEINDTCMFVSMYVRNVNQDIPMVAVTEMYIA